MSKKLTVFRIVLIMTLFVLVVACSSPDRAPVHDQDDLVHVSIMLDWAPNTHHTGLFVAQEQGYFEDYGLSVDIVEVGEAYAEQVVTSGHIEFGISFQEMVTLLRSNSGAPLVSIATIVQHNTSGFAVRAGIDADSPEDWNGLTYGAFGTPFEAPTLKALMDCYGGDFSKLNMLEVGYSDPLILLEANRVQLAWVYYGVEGIQAQLRGVELNIMMMEQYFDCIPDYYSPVIITSEDMIAENPDIVRAFLSAVSLGYEYAVNFPQRAATIMLDTLPGQDRAFIYSSLEWLAPRFAADAPRWGYQDLTVWETYGNWMIQQAIIQDFNAEDAFTNDFLPVE